MDYVPILNEYFHTGLPGQLILTDNNHKSFREGKLIIIRSLINPFLRRTEKVGWNRERKEEIKEPGGWKILEVGTNKGL